MAKTTQRTPCATLLVISYPELFLSITLYCISKANDVFGSATGTTKVCRTWFRGAFIQVSLSRLKLLAIKPYRIFCQSKREVECITMHYQTSWFIFGNT